MESKKRRWREAVFRNIGEKERISNGKETRERSAIISEDADGLIWFADRSASIRERTAVDSVVIKGIEWRTE